MNKGFSFLLVPLTLALLYRRGLFQTDMTVPFPSSVS